MTTYVQTYRTSDLSWLPGGTPSNYTASKTNYIVSILTKILNTFAFLVKNPKKMSCLAMFQDTENIFGSDSPDASVFTKRRKRQTNNGEKMVDPFSNEVFTEQGEESQINL